MRHFVVKYHKPSGDVTVDEFGQKSSAWAHYQELEKLRLESPRWREHEIVLLNADSLATIKKTHSRYWLRADQ